MTDNSPQQIAPNQPGFAPMQPAPARGTQPGRGRKGLLAGAVGVVTLGLVGGGITWLDPFDWRNGGVEQTPAAVLPADTEFYATVDFDPSLGQKVEMVRFAMKFPSLKQKVSLTEDGDIKKQLFEAIAKDSCPTINYDADVKPWLGDHLGVALRKGETDPVVAIETKDEKAAKDGLKKIADCDGAGNHEMGLAYVDGYVVAAGNQAEADKAVADAKANPLSKRAEFGEDLDKLGETGIASVWVAKSLLDREGAEIDPSGSFEPNRELIKKMTMRSAAATLRFTDGNPELHMVTKSAVPVAKSSKHTAVGDLPADSTIAIGLADGKQVIQQAWPEIEKAMQAEGGDMSQVEQQLGMPLKDAFETLMGDDLRLAVGTVDAEALQGGDYSSLPAGLALTTDAAKLDQLVEASGVGANGVVVEKGDKTQGLAMNADFASRLANGGGEKLSSKEKFTKAVPNADKSQSVVFVDIEALLGQLGESMPAEQRKDIEPLKAVGISGGIEDGDYSVGTLRVLAK